MGSTSGRPTTSGRRRESFPKLLSRMPTLTHSSPSSYSLAESLHSQLDSLSRSLTSMIDEVNALSSSSSTAGPSGSTTTGAGGDASSTTPISASSSKEADDPIAQIGQILNAHLTSLQWIDGASVGMKEKVVELERRLVDVNGGGEGGRAGRRAVDAGGSLASSTSKREGGGGSGRFGLGRR